MTVSTNWHQNYKSEIFSAILHFPQAAFTAIPSSFSKIKADFHVDNCLPLDPSNTRRLN